jgi:hypothetical protein
VVDQAAEQSLTLTAALKRGNRELGGKEMKFAGKLQ